MTLIVFIVPGLFSSSVALHLEIPQEIQHKPGHFDSE